MHVKKGDNIIVIAGKHKGAKGSVSRVLLDRVIVDGVNKVKVHVRAKNKNEKGSIVEREASIHHSNVKLAEKKQKTKAK
jgi:large subunit ribosomal protein L24